MTSIRVNERTHELLQALAKAEHKPISAVVEDAVQRYQEERLWRDAEKAYQRLRDDPAAWQDWQQEVALFESASMDGLADYPYDEDE